MIKEELYRKLLRGRTRLRAVGYEERIMKRENDCEKEDVGRK